MQLVLGAGSRLPPLRAIGQVLEGPMPKNYTNRLKIVTCRIAPGQGVSQDMGVAVLRQRQSGLPMVVGHPSWSIFLRVNWQEVRVSGQAPLLGKSGFRKEGMERIK